MSQYGQVASTFLLLAPSSEIKQSPPLSSHTLLSLNPNLPLRHRLNTPNPLLEAIHGPVRGVVPLSGRLNLRFVVWRGVIIVVRMNLLHLIYLLRLHCGLRREEG